MLALEPRIMFDGAMAGDVVDATVGDEDPTLQNIAVNDQEHAEKESTRNEVVIVDGAIANYQSIISSIGSDADVFILGKNAALSDIANLLSDRSGVDAIHIFTHGSPGTLLIGDHLYDENNISGYADALAEIGASLTETGDILLYGCNIAATGEGKAFIEKFAELTSADVAGSDDVTGNIEKGGDWELEHRSGTIETDAKEVNEFDGVLLTTILEDPTTNNGDAVSTINSTGIAVVAQDNSNGTWKFSTDGSSFGNINGSSGNARLLDGSNAGNKIKFVPNSNFNGTATITFRTWDRSTGTAGDSRCRRSDRCTTRLPAARRSR